MQRSFLPGLPGIIARAWLPALLLLVPGSAWAADLPWEAPAFTWDPKAALEAAKKLPERPHKEDAKQPKDDDEDQEIPIDVLLRDTSYSFDADGRLTQTSHLVYWCRTKAGASYWSNVEASWNPSRQQKPEVRARVITPDGEVRSLDPRTLSEGNSGDDSDSDTFTDVRTLRAPLPAMKRGVIVEEENVVRDNAPAFAAGVVNRYSFETGLPSARRTRVHVDAPVSVPLKYAVLGHGVTARAGKTAGRQILDVDVGLLADDDTWEVMEPHDAARAPELLFSTGRSWKEIATAYSKVVDERVAAAPVADRAKEWVGDAKERGEIARRLLAGLHKTLRYTALEIGPNTLIPHTPAEVLANKYGDCKDMSTLLVALLRAAGVPARVALLRTSWDEVVPSLPGVTSFNHAIVYVPGATPLWIDPTDYDVPVGLLPVEDQGRLALIANPHSTKLVPTPEAEASDSREIATREFYLSEDGPSRVVETIEATGTTGAEYRSGIRTHELKDIRHRYMNWAKDRYAAASVTRLELPEVEAVDKPFHMTAELTGVQRGWTSEKEAVVYVDPSILLGDLPRPLRSPGGEARSKRRTDFLILKPYTYDLTYRIVPPPGYAARAFPNKAPLRLGPFPFTRTLQAEPSGEVRVVYHLAVDRRRLTPEEFRQVRDDAAAFGKEPFRVSFDHKGWLLAQEGKTREAIEEYRKLIELHPKEALHRAQLARVLLEASAGDEARAEALKATDVEPKSVYAWHLLAWVREHDLIGRLHRPGYDQAGAVAAYREGLKLDPKNEAIHRNLASLLLLDSQGEEFGPSAHLEEALKELRYLRDELKIKDIDNQLTWCLLKLGRPGDVLALAPSLADTVQMQARVIAAKAIVEGVPAALGLAANAFSDAEQQRQALSRAGGELMLLRYYPESSALLLESVKDTPRAEDNRELFERIGKTKRYESLPAAGKDPVSPVWEMYTALFTGGSAHPDLHRLFAERAYNTERAGELPHTLTGVRQGLQAALHGLAPEVALDITRSNAVVTTDGNDEVGYRIVIKLSLPEAEDQSSRFFVVQEAGAYRIYAFEETPDMLGAEALQVAGLGRLDAARQWLDWALDLPRVGRNELFVHHWSRTGPRDLPAIRHAAAILMAAGSYAGDTIPILKELRAQEKNAEDARKLGLALAASYLRTKQFAPLLDVVQAMMPADHVTDELFELRNAALSGLKRPQEQRSFAEARLRESPHNGPALAVLMSVAALVGDFDTAEKAGREGIAQEDERGHTYYNELAWIALCRGNVTPQAIDDAKKSVTLTHSQSHADQHTLASLYAEVGRVVEARETILNAINVGGGEPTSDDWYVFGRLYEQYGLKQAAIAAYSRVELKDANIPISTAYLTQRRLDAILGTSAGK